MLCFLASSDLISGRLSLLRDTGLSICVQVVEAESGVDPD
jgi:hypothetical protein